MAAVDRPLALKATTPEQQELLNLLAAEQYDVNATYEAIAKLPVPAEWGRPGFGRSERTLADEFKEMVPPGQTLGSHTKNAAIQLERYFPDESEQGLTRAAYRLMVLMHDAGKAAARRLRNNREYQYTYTEQLLDALAPRLPVDERSLARMKILLRSDPLGPYLRMDSKQVDLPTTLEILQNSAREAGMSPEGYFKALTRYYQSDASSYTKEVNAAVRKDTFDRVFQFADPETSPNRALVFDEADKRITFSPEVERRWVALRDAISGLDGARSSGARGVVPYSESAAAAPVGTLPEGFPATLGDLRVVKGLQGGAQLRQDAAGDLWVTKPDGDSAGAVAEEVLADELYTVLGLGMPSALYRDAGGDTKVFRLIEDAKRFREARDPRVAKAAQRAFASHALLGHEGVYSGSNAVRVAFERGEPSLSVVDAAGALRRGPNGEPRRLSAVPTELWTERDAFPYTGLRWSQVLRQVQEVLRKKDALLAVADRDPELRQLLEGRLDNMAYLVQATAALRGAGIRPLQIESELKGVMEAVKGGAARPTLPELVGSVRARPIELPQNAGAILNGSQLQSGQRYLLGDASVTVRKQLGYLPSARMFQVENDVAGLEQLPIMVLVDPVALQRSATKYALLRQDPLLAEVFPGAIPRILQGSPGVLFHSELPGVALEELNPALRERALAGLTELSDYADNQLAERGLRVGRSPSYARFNEETGEVTGWNGFLADPPPGAPVSRPTPPAPPAAREPAPAPAAARESAPARRSAPAGEAAAAPEAPARQTPPAAEAPAPAAES